MIYDSLSSHARETTLTQAQEQDQRYGRDPPRPLFRSTIFATSHERQLINRPQPHRKINKDTDSNAQNITLKRKMKTSINSGAASSSP